MSWLTLIGSILSLVGLIFKELFSASARAREEQKQFEITQAEFLKAAESSILKMKEQARQETQQSKSIYDRVDEFKKKQ